MIQHLRAMDRPRLTPLFAEALTEAGVLPDAAAPAAAPLVSNKIILYYII
jgi:hypothetical protein